MESSIKGSALVITLVMFFIVSILVVTGYQLITTSYKEMKYQQTWVLQAENVARAGIVDAIAWFRRQPVQPVRSGVPPTFYPWVDGAFHPRFSTGPVHCDTIDETIGLVKEYQLSESDLRWARYEVKRQTDPAVGPYDTHAVHDITGERLHTGDPSEQNGEGLVWYIESTGYVFRRHDDTKPYNISPNEVVAKARVSTEIRRLKLQLPAECAYIVKDGGSWWWWWNRKVKIYKNGRIIGGDKIGCGRVSGLQPLVYSGGIVTGSPRFQSGLDDPTPNYVFGVSTSDLKSLADYAVDSVSSLPFPLPDMSLIYIDGNATFNSSKPLRSSGILFVNGNLTISAESNSLFNGLIYVTGNATIYDPCLISGCVIAYTGLILSRSLSTDVAEIDYDSSILNSVRQQICQYRENRSVYRVFSGISGQ